MKLPSTGRIDQSIETVDDCERLQESGVPCLLRSAEFSRDHAAMLHAPAAMRP